MSKGGGIQVVIHVWVFDMRGGDHVEELCDKSEEER